MKKIYIFLTTFFLTVPFPLNADDYQKSDGFFGSNNALTPLGKNQEFSEFKNNSEFEKGNLFEKDNSFFGEKFNDKKLSKTHKTNNEKEKAQKSSNNIFASNNQEIVSGSKIISLGLVVNAINKKHFSQVMEKLMTTVDDFDLDAGQIYLNGIINESMYPLITPMVARGSIASSHFTIPEEFNISYSPTWIIQTSEGRILLEGVSNLRRYINKKGEFVEAGVPAEQRVGEREDNTFKGGSIFFE